MDSVISLFEKNNLPLSRMLSYSKGSYRLAFPENDVIFNANIFTFFGKIWYGDLDLTLDSNKLQSIADQSKTTLFVLLEMDGRFENESLTLEEIKNQAVKTFTPK